MKFHVTLFNMPEGQERKVEKRMLVVYNIS
jgi:hypothetical protein